MLAKQGKIPVEDLEKFPNPPYIGLAETGIPGVWVSGGSMGHGLPIAVGMALAKKRANEPGKIYCIMSDGEMNEGTTWEAAALAAHHRLNNLHVIVDKNGWQAMGKTEDILQITFPNERWYMESVDGHNYKYLEWAINMKIRCDECDGAGVLNNDSAQFRDYKKWQADDGSCIRCGGKGIYEDFDANDEGFGKDKPRVIICETVKGKGVSFMENINIWHYKLPNQEEYELALKELNG